MNEKCAICGCKVHRDGNYAEPTPKGRSHATFHHYVAERFFGRSANRRGTLRKPVFLECPWNLERRGDIYCYECHEVLLHNPVFTKEDIDALCEIVTKRGLNEKVKPRDRKKLAGRIELLHEIIAAGLEVVREGKRAAVLDGRRP